jgi:hypothetical protein
MHMNKSRSIILALLVLISTPVNVKKRKQANVKRGRKRKPP